MVEADSHLKPLFSSMLDIYKVFEHIDMLFNDILPTSMLEIYKVLEHIDMLFICIW
jgi:hypothetical protein